MKKKMAALALAMGMSFVVLTGCGSGSQPVAEETTEAETEVETAPTEKATEETTEEPKVTEKEETAEPTVEAEPEKDVIIPLSMQIGSLDGDWSAFSPEKYDRFYNLQKITVDQLPQSEQEIGTTGELAELVDVDARNLELSDYSDREVRYPCAFFFDVHTYSNYSESDMVLLQVLIDGKWYPILYFVPLFYNETKGTIVGIDITPSSYTVGEVKFSEISYSQKLGDSIVSEIPEEESEQYFDAYYGW